MPNATYPKRWQTIKHVMSITQKKK